jgi:hypothetical protein
LPWREIWRKHAILRVHPSYLLEPEDLLILDLWLAWRRDGMGGAGYLPFAGGYAQQPSALMRALEAMTSCDGLIRDRRRRDDDGD